MTVRAFPDETAKLIVDSAFTIHRSLGPGLLESVYETCLAHELTKRGAEVLRQLALPVHYDGLRLEGGFRLDLLVNNAVVIEVKAVERMEPIFQAQLLTYLRLSGKSLGLLINFNVPRIKDGIKRLVI